MTNDAQIVQILSAKDTSFHLKLVLRQWLERDPVDAARDAEMLAKVLCTRADEMLAAEMQTASLATLPSKAG